jgi:Zn-dependent peptidase ImmA (M78 family)
MTNANPISPAVLRWARVTAGLTTEDVVAKLKRKKVTATTIEEWEQGASSPTYLQLEALAYKVYKRPLAIFFFPLPPDEETPQQEFRTLPDSAIEQLSPRMRYLLRQATAMQVNLRELFEGSNPAESQILRKLRFDLDMPIDELAQSVRDFLGVTIEQQLRWRSSDTAFKEWRSALEEHGVFVFKDAFRDDTVSGFCLDDKDFPLIYVNNSSATTRQIFTLFHELAHLLAGTGGIDTPRDLYIASMSGNNRRIEVLCNQFAGAFLVPREHFRQQVAENTISESRVADLSREYSVSREVILRRLLDDKLISQAYYSQLVGKWTQEGPKSSGSGGDYYLTKRVYLGERYLTTVFSQHYQGKISVEQLADYLGVKVRNVPGMETLLFPLGAPA